MYAVLVRTLHLLLSSRLMSLRNFQELTSSQFNESPPLNLHDPGEKSKSTANSGNSISCSLLVNILSDPTRLQSAVSAVTSPTI